MDETITGRRGWAILIGINIYVKDKSLKGCARDVETIEQYLRSASRPPDIVKYTATGPSSSLTRCPEEEPELLPTYQNVVSSLQRVLANAKPGDLVYLHFSGHGARNPLTGALALVLYDRDHGSSYLYGSVLASVLEKMVGRGLLVTLVLDCCFSGSDLRHDNYGNTDVRMVKYDFDVEAMHPPPKSETTSVDILSPLRNAHIPPNWMIDPKGYTIITACGPHEIAMELEIQSREKRGALSYFLIEALTSLRRSGVVITHSSLYQHLLTRIHASWPRQTPMRYGNENLCFFGGVISKHDSSSASVLRRIDKVIRLNVGYAHGVHEGDEYAVCPIQTSKTSLDSTNRNATRLRAVNVQCLISDLTQMEPTPEICCVETGWKAKLLTRSAPCSIAIGISSTVRDRSQLIEITEQHEPRRFHVAQNHKEPCLFHVSCNTSNEYEIRDNAYTRMKSLPSIPTTEEMAKERILGIIDHLAEFKRFESIENRDPNTYFEQSFTVSSDQDTRAKGLCHIKHGDTWHFNVANLSEKPLYLFLFDLRPSGQIRNLILESGAEFIVVEPQGKPKDKRGISVVMKVPGYLQYQGQQECEDVMKVFLTGRPSSFALDVLPPIPRSARELGNNSRCSTDQLLRFLSALESPNRGNEDESWYGSWACRNFLVCTSVG